jgi:hypothetical protein
MRTRSWLVAASAAGLVWAGPLPAQAPDPSFTSRFVVAADEWSSSGTNPYMSLVPGHTLVLEDGSERLTITVLNETRQVDGVETRVVEERETDKGQPVEVSRNYFAISRRTNAVYYFGEDVDEYKDGKVASHGGSWLSGVNGARFGMMMPGEPLVRGRYYQELAPGVAMDRAEIMSVSDTLRTPAGTFTDVLRIQETSPLEPLVRESKYYAGGVGLLQDGSLKLVKYGLDPGR